MAARLKVPFVAPVTLGTSGMADHKTAFGSVIHQRFERIRGPSFSTLAMMRAADFRLGIREEAGAPRSMLWEAV